jgi:alkylation response protein AidB-like acyl-CoA dehydrogenase
VTDLAARQGPTRSANFILVDMLEAFGTDEQKDRLLEPVRSDEVGTCLLYSEPVAGSDLASPQTGAERDGEGWVVDGQKVWTTLAHEADYGLLLARTDWDVPKHRGITFFILPMRQPGVEVRPLRQITGDREFNEVFLTEARVPPWGVMGAVGDGWRVLQTALASERKLMGSRRPSRDAGADSINLARKRGRSNDPIILSEMARLEILKRVNELNAIRVRADLEAGRASPMASIGKLAMSEILHSGAALNQAVLGAEAMLMAPDSPEGDSVNRASMTAFINSIGGGSDQIQRNVTAERILGLPREPEADRNLPFRQARKAQMRPRRTD